MSTGEPGGGDFFTNKDTEFPGEVQPTSEKAAACPPPAKADHPSSPSPTEDTNPVTKEKKEGKVENVELEVVAKESKVIARESATNEYRVEKKETVEEGKTE